jgi:hypothetical protein
VTARVDQKIHMLGAVVNGVEPPQERELMAPAMAPVEADLADDHGGDHSHP